VNRIDAPILGVVAALDERPTFEFVEQRDQPAWHHPEKRSERLLADAGVGGDRGGGGDPIPFLQTSEERWRSTVDANLTATFLTIHTFAPAMVERRRGAVVTMSSSAGRLPGLASPAYAASKAGIVMLTGHLARELAPMGVRVNCVAPSAIMNDRLAKLPPEKLREIAAGFPLGRLGVPEDVALATLYLVSESSSWVTGVTLDISGGRIIV
jgi:3-oxoacyl-[acyl-carrier protein] reductase